MNYTDYSVIKEGARSYRFTLPCFSSYERFYDAIRMNRFYAAVMRKLYCMGEQLILSDERRSSYTCMYKVTENSQTEEVEIIISLRYSGCKAYRHSILHVWENGYIISEKIVSKF